GSPRPAAPTSRSTATSCGLPGRTCGRTSARTWPSCSTSPARPPRPWCRSSTAAARGSSPGPSRCSPRPAASSTRSSPRETTRSDPMVNPDEMRIGDRERDAVAELLQEAYAEGRIGRDELDERLTAALSARTAGELRAITADLTGPSGPGHPHHPHGPRHRPTLHCRPVRHADAHPGFAWPGPYGGLAWRPHPAVMGWRRAAPGIRRPTGIVPLVLVIAAMAFFLPWL